MYKIQEVSKKEDFMLIQKLEHIMRKEDMKNGNMIQNINEVNINFLKDLPKGYFIFYKNEEIVGYLRIFAPTQFSRINFRYTLWPFFIISEFRWQGLGKIFLNMLFLNLEKKHPKKLLNIVLAVAEKNISAIKLYTSCGFTIFWEEQFHLKFQGKFQNALWMQKILNY